MQVGRGGGGPEIVEGNVDICTAKLEGEVVNRVYLEIQGGAETGPVVG